MLEIGTIENILTDNKGGIRTIEITDQANPDFDDQIATIHAIPFRLNSADLGESSTTGSGGKYVNQTVTFTIPKKRTDIERLLKKLANTKFNVRLTDYNETTTRILPARINHKYKSGKRPNESNQYDFQFIGVELYHVGTSIPYQGTPLGNTTAIDGVAPIPVNVEPSADPPNAGTSTPNYSECANIIISPFQTYNDLNANFENLPAAYTLQVLYNDVEVATALPHTISESGTYYIKITETTTGCSRISGLYMEFNTEPVDFTIGITVGEDQLEATTDATSPTYLWELEQENGNRIPIGHESIVPLNLVGIYHLTITQGVTSKTAYYLYQITNANNVRVINLTELANPYRLVDALIGVSGDTFATTQIDLSKVNNPAIQLTVTRNGVTLNYTATTPNAVDQYSIVGSNIVVWSTVPLNAEDLIITLNI